VEEIERRPDPERMIEASDKIGYDNTAVADVVDNLSPPMPQSPNCGFAADLAGNIRLSIADNGDGMNRARGFKRDAVWIEGARPSAASLGKGYGLVWRPHQRLRKRPR